MIGRFFRSMIAATARRFPPKHLADRLLPWTALLAAVIGAWAALYQYSNDLAIERYKTTLDMHKQFRASNGDWYETLLVDAKGVKVPFDQLVIGILTIRCKVYEQSIASHEMVVGTLSLPKCDHLKTQHHVALDKFNTFVPPAVKKVIRDQMNTFMARDFQIKRTRFFDMSRYMRALIICIDHKTCDDETAIALFGAEMIGFVNNACQFSNALGPEAIEDLRFIANYLIAADIPKQLNWSTRRGNLFVCSFLRDLENPQPRRSRATTASNQMRFHQTE